MTKNIGVVVYKKGPEPGTLDAEWSISTGEKGTGRASGGPQLGWAGQYRIQYFGDDGSLDAELDLEIVEAGQCFRLSWSKDGIPKARGIGIATDESLAAGWQRVVEDREPDS